MASVSLSPELRARIFHYLSPSRIDIANCRLVCKEFHSIASEFLITRIVIAKRSDALQHVLDILGHPFFRLHVAELVYDASCYSGHLAHDPVAYSRLCNHTARKEDHIKGSSRDMLEGTEESQKPLAELSQRIRMIQGIDGSQVQHLSPRDQAQRAYSSFLEYGRRWAEREGIFHNRLHLAILQMALTRLPKLRWLLYTDFRHFAKEQEPYLECSWRLFGNVVEPSGVDFTHEGKLEFLHVLSLIKNTPEACIRGFQIGEHPYEHMNAKIDAENVTSGYHIAWNEPGALPHDFLPNKLTLIDTYEDDTDSDAHVVPGIVTDMEADLSPMLELDGLRYLRLPVRIPLVEALDEDIIPIVPLTDVPKSNVKCFLDRSGKDLVSLELCAVQSELLEFDETKQGLEINRDYMTALLDGLVFPNLKHLTLQNWVLPGHALLENFFSRHRSTLKEVNLLQCFVAKDQVPTDFGKWAGQNLSLVGVSIDIHPEAKMEILVKRNDNDLEPWDDSEDGDTDWRRHDGNLQEQIGYRTASAAFGEPYPWTKTELEALWLSGRPNSLKVAAMKPYPFKAPRKSPFDTLSDWSE